MVHKGWEQGVPNVLEATGALAKSKHMVMRQVQPLGHELSKVLTSLKEKGKEKARLSAQVVAKFKQSTHRKVTQREYKEARGLRPHCCLRFAALWPFLMACVAETVEFASDYSNTLST